MISLRIKKSMLLTIIAAALAGITVLLNQRQELAIYPAIAIQCLAIAVIPALVTSERRTGFSASKILFALFLLALISNLSYFRSDILSPLEHWARLLFPIFLVPLSTYLTTKSTSSIRVFSALFVTVALLASYKAHTIGEVLARLNPNSLQSNWGNALAASSPFIFLIRKKLLKNALLFFVIVALVVSLKRTALLAVGILLFTSVLANYLTIKKWPRLTARSAGAFILTLIGTAFAFTKISQNENLIASYERAMVRLGNSISDGGSGRTSIWADSMSIMYDASFWKNIFGHGFGWFHDNSRSLGFTVESLHNDLLDFWVSFGALGVVIYLTLIGRLGYLAIFVAKKSPDHAAFATSSVLIFYTYSLFAGIFYYFMFFVPLFVALGFLETLKAVYSRRSV